MRILKGSTTGALLTVTEEWHYVLEMGGDVCAISLDLSKAFDVPHTPLQAKLVNLNLPHSLLV